MIYFFKPYFPGDLGKAYNMYMNLLLNDDDWGCLMDGDTMFLRNDYGKQLQEIIALYPDTGLFTCLTNRVGSLFQCYNEEISDNADISYHKLIANECYLQNRLEVENIDTVISGHMMLIQKKTWKQVKFKSGILGVDNDFSRKIMALNKPILLMKGVYVFHYYRLLSGINDKSHLI